MNDSRYARQIRYPGIGEEGQRRLAGSDVAVLGCGALGSVAAELLGRAGVGRLRLIDRDVVEWSNLQRQSLYDERDADAAAAKAEAAAEHLSKINSTIRVDPIVRDVTPDNIAETLDGCDLVIDATDHFAIRFLLNDWSLETRTAWVHGGAVGAVGQVHFFTGRGGPCFRCLMPEPPAGAVPTCDTAGVIGPVTHVVASLQVAEAMKWLVGAGERVRSGVLSLDIWSNRFRSIDTPEELSRSCPACGGARRDWLRGDAGRSMTTTARLCGRQSVQVHTGVRVDGEALAERWSGLGEVTRTRFFTRLSADDHRLTVFADGRVLVDGTDDITTAKGLVTRYVGG